MRRIAEMAAFHWQLEHWVGRLENLRKGRCLVGRRIASFANQTSLWGLENPCSTRRANLALLRRQEVRKIPVELQFGAPPTARSEKNTELNSAACSWPRGYINSPLEHRLVGIASHKPADQMNTLPD